LIQIVPAEKRHYSDFGWLKTYWLFSFAEYYDPNNIQFGALRVFNDDIVEEGTGFPTHPHHEMEIITIVLEGEISHKDSMGNETVIRAGEVQRMSAGTGLTHSEFNLAEKPVHFYQIWIYPDIRRAIPSYDQKSFEGISRLNRLLPVASGQKLPDTVTFQTNATVYLAALEARREIKFNLAQLRKGFLYLTKGEIAINGNILHAKDQARIAAEGKLSFRATELSEFVFIDVP
jgi:quercetin 2,3-dioxygenase